ncbi:hypothetical protein AAHA92_29107 [Salvia divinorum]|uniref:Uncharacterized protein n=1 Tax=Salvia divinorum TaxID=28513 RepID=A0ABD1FXA1_SALDI
MRGNEGKIPATVRMPGKDNVSMITLRSSRSNETDKLTKETGQAGNVFDLQRKDLRAPLSKSTGPSFLELEATDGKGNKEKKEEEVLLPESSSNEKIQTSEKIKVDKKASAVIQEELPSKHADPGMFTLPITMGEEKIDHAICDLGASTNILPLSIYQKMKGAKMVHTEKVIQLADGSCIHPEGILEHTIVKVQGFLYPADFYLIKMIDAESDGSSRVLLGRPFLKTAKALIDVFAGTICLNYHGKKYTFGVDETTLSLSMEGLNAVSIAKPLVQESEEEKKLKENFEAGGVEGLEEEAAKWLEDTQTRGLTDQELHEAMMSFCQVPKAAKPRGRCQVEGIARIPKLNEQNLLMIGKGVKQEKVVNSENVIDPEEIKGDGGEVNEEKDKGDLITLAKRPRGENGQKMQFTQSKLKWMPRKWRPEWTKPFTIGALGADPTTGLRGSPFYTNPFIFYCPWVKICKDGSEVRVVKEISLRVTALSFI